MLEYMIKLNAVFIEDNSDNYFGISIKHTDKHKQYYYCKHAHFHIIVEKYGIK